MNDSVLSILKLCFLAILYLFLARVVRAVWVEISPERVPADPLGGRTVSSGGSAPLASGSRVAVKEDARLSKAGRRDGDESHTVGRKGRKGRRSAVSTAVKIVEPPDQRGVRYVLADENTVGRGAGCAVPLSDTYASQLHARIFRRDGQLFVEDLGSTNGTWLNRKQVHGPIPLHPGDRLQVGHTVLEVER